MKQETPEEAAEKYANKKGDVPITELENAIFKQGFIDGAKWQQERSYSEENLKEAFKDAYSLGFRDWLQANFKQEKCDEWFKKFKNK